MSAGYVPVCNVTDRPIVVDDEGRTLGGGEWGAARKNAEQVKAALGRGDLAELDGEAGTPESRAAVDQARTLEERAAAFAKLDRDALDELAGQSDYTDWRAGQTIDELRHALTVRTGIPTPASRRSSSTTTEEK